MDFDSSKFSEIYEQVANNRHLSPEDFVMENYPDADDETLKIIDACFAIIKNKQEDVQYYE